MEKQERIDLSIRLKFDQIISLSIDIYKNHFIYFIKLMSVIFIPSVILLGAYFLSNYSDLTKLMKISHMEKIGEDQLFKQFFPLWGKFFLAGMIGYIAYFLSLLNVVRGANFIILNEEEIPFGDVTTSVLKMTLKILITSVLVLIVFMMGSVLCIIPGIIFAIYMTFVNQINVIEERYYFYSIVRSFSLMKNHFWSVFGITIIFYLAYYTISGGLQGAIMAGDYIEIFKTTLKGGPEAAEKLSKIHEQLFVKSLIASIFGLIIMILLQPILQIALTLKFLNVRKLKEENLDVA